MKTVAVITRTKDRPLLLHRAGKSVADQTFRDFVWVIVNDGGQAQPVDEVATQVRQDHIEVVVVHKYVSAGMEAASNTGIRGSTSEFIVIHDDDDTWHPQFLERTVPFLKSSAGALYGGVITHTIKVREEIKNDRCNIISSQPHNDWIAAVYLSDMATMNMFPPISFLFRRSLYDQIKGYDEQLPVLGDWLFNLQFLRIADIGVIREPLAYYHQRINVSTPSYENTVLTGVGVHEQYDAIIRNRLMREDIEASRIGLGYLVNRGKDYAGPLSLLGMQRLKRKLNETRYGRVFARLLNRIG